MTGLSTKTDFYQLFEKGLLFELCTTNISFLASISVKKSRINESK